MPTPAQDALKAYLKPEFPKIGVSSGSYSTELVYVGDYNTLFTESPALGDAWEPYIGKVVDVLLERIPGTDPLMGELMINMGADFEAAESGGTPGTSDGITYEVDWTVVNRPLIEHPTWGTGFYELYSDDYKAIAVWEDDKTDANYNDLTTNAAKYADGILKGILTYDDFAPVLTMTTAYINGPPSSSSAGAKEDPPAEFPNQPTGYEWIKSADRSLKAGKKNRWERIEQWMGAKKVLVDKNEIYY